MEEKEGGEKVRLGMVVRYPRGKKKHLWSTDSEGTNISQVIRGNSVVMLEALERIGGDDRHR